ncbi:MAG: hypothetical protein A2Y10_17405 [Planctomycetes bacterium GWF2_41_51]|nr:MAG: hypothetical protein A2Y10_17405 [Planctomycetes bacterium GWF2_41_51]HBG28004.1 hypothetical protein [Phycisphaerales bacterium]
MKFRNVIFVILMATELVFAARIRPAKFPIGFWPTGMPELNEQMVETWADAGFTLTYVHQNSPDKIKRVLDWAQKNGIQIIVDDSRSIAYDAGRKPLELELYKKQLISVIADYSNHPALFGIKIADEPSPTHNLASMVGKATKIFTELTPDIQPIINHHPWYPVSPYYHYKNFDEFTEDVHSVIIKNGAEIISYDCYAQLDYGSPQEGINLFFDSLYNYSNYAKKHNCDFWTIILATPHILYDVPSEDSIRWQFNCALAYGAKGIFYYTFYTPLCENFRCGPIDNTGRKTEKFDWLRRTHRRFQTLYGDLFLHLELLSVQQVGRVSGSTKAFEPDECVSAVYAGKGIGFFDIKQDPNHPFIISRFRDKNGSDFILIVNNSKTVPVHCVTRFAKKDSKIIRFEYGATAYKYKNTVRAKLKEAAGGIETDCWLASGQEVLYLIEDSNSLEKHQHE